MRVAVYFWLTHHRVNGKEVIPKYKFALFVTNEHLTGCLTMKLAKTDEF